jgi:hypothetical protein
MNSCDECRFYNLMTGFCSRFSILRHSCGEDACDEFELVDHLKEYQEKKE